jgi:FkbM family methyltransferase
MQKAFKKLLRRIIPRPVAVAEMPGEIMSRGEAKRVASLPRKQSSTATIMGRQIRFPDGYWFMHSLNELFVEEVYRFNTDNPSPYILDCGANIGLSVIYFKRLYPNARIVAFEPDEKIFSQMKDNLSSFNIEDVDTVSKGVWKEETTLTFLAEGTLGGKVIDKDQPAGKLQVININTVRLRDYVAKKVDFLKLDIEGAEYEVLVDCADALGNVSTLFIEYHSSPSKEQTLDEILRIVTNAGFRYYIKEASHDVRYPFVDAGKQTWFDLQLNIFCYRP